MANTYQLIEAKTLTTTTASITFSSIPITYTDLKIVTSSRADFATEAFEIALTFNGNTSNYSAKQLYGSGSAAGSSSPTIRPAGFITGTTATSNTFANGEIYILNYLSSNYKSYSVDSTTENNGTISYMNFVAGLWSDTSAINSVSLAPTSGYNFVAYSNFYLYGIKKS